MVAIVLVNAILFLLIFGGDDPDLSPQDQSTPTSAPQTSAPDPRPASVEPGATRVRITDDALSVSPRSVELQDGYLTLQMENAASSPVELALVKGDQGANAIVAMPLERGVRRTDQVGVDAGTYTLLVREPGDDESPGRARETLRLR